MLELVKYRWEPADFIKLILCNAVILLCLKQLFPSTIFLGTPMVMTFLYMYAREYEMQVMNLLGFFSIRCGWLPFAQMLQDFVQMGDVSATCEASEPLAVPCTPSRPLARSQHAQSSERLRPTARRSRPICWASCRGTLIFTSPR